MIKRRKTAVREKTSFSQPLNDGICRALCLPVAVVGTDPSPVELPKSYTIRINKNTVTWSAVVDWGDGLTVTHTRTMPKAKLLAWMDEQDAKKRASA
jgi:acyl dehydratase